MESKNLYLNESKNVYFKDNFVIKKYDIGIREEYIKSKHIFELSKKLPFIFPEPLEKNGDNYIKFQNVKAEKSIREEYISFMRGMTGEQEVYALFERVGAVLAKLHNNMVLCDKKHWFPPEPFIKAMKKCGVSDIDSYTRRLPESYMHCDFGFSNISVNQKNGKKDIVIYDASPNNFTTFATNYLGPVYIDIGNMISCLNGLVPVRNYFFMKWNKLPALKTAFLNGYQDNTSNEIDIDWVDKFSYATAHCYFEKQYGESLKQKAAITMLYNEFKHNNLSIYR
jgi:hypothetical protein